MNDKFIDGVVDGAESIERLEVNLYWMIPWLQHVPVFFAMFGS